MTLNVENPEGAVAPGTTAPVLSVRDLNVYFPSESGRVHAVRGVNFDLMPGKVLGIVGESGSGKSVTSLAIMGLLVESARVEGSISLQGKELLGKTDKQLSAVRGKDIAMIFQDPLSSLSPVYTVGRQLSDALLIHNPEMTKAAVQERSIELLRLVGIPSPAERLRAYPHEFSGGMRQRVMIAIAICNNPKVIIADEPTTALDVTIQAQILSLLGDIQKKTGAAVIMITHDLGVIAGMADDVLVMYAGRPVETAGVHEIFARPRMPYTVGLLGSIPRVDERSKHALVPIEGAPPNLIKEPTGCPFSPRCPISTAECEEGEPTLEPLGPDAAGAGHRVACRRVDVVNAASVPQEIYGVKELKHSAIERVPREQRETYLELKNVKKYFPLTKGGVFRRVIGEVRAADDITFDVREGECLSIVGESGSGKTTTLLEVMEFDKKQSGEIIMHGLSNHTARSAALERELRKTVQIVFQDPMGALDPRFTVYEIIAEPMQNAGYDNEKIKRRIFELMRIVGLQPDHVNRFPVQFSGGQRQRIGIARALALQPKLVVLDEPVSALDVSVQAGVINLLHDLKTRLNLSYLMVAHDLSVVRHLSDRVAVMYLGRLVEVGDVDEVFDNPQHPYTKALLSAIPTPDPDLERTRERILLEGDLPTPLEAPVGCNFASRCPLYKALPLEKKHQCDATNPQLLELKRGAQSVACFHVESAASAVSTGGK
ncbi:ABC transporter ATP-binding protein [Micrococcales bacterium 31B]|nr:ABC transporter ATP-binding protein [Micrococcales bacterium 31B]